MNLHRAAAALVIAALTAAGFFTSMPGHTWLASDTQIYAPILERMWDPGVFAADPVASRPHVGYSIYDETALVLRKITGAGFEHVLGVLMLGLRFFALAGIFLIGRAAGLSNRLAILVAAIFGIGMFLTGPSILTIEYEPIPRGFALPLVLLAIGLACHQKWPWAGAAAGLALMFHPPTTFPFLVVFGLYALLRPGRVWWALAPIAGAAVLTVALAWLRGGESATTPLLSRVSPDVAELQKLRASYNYIALWGEQWIRQYEFLWLVALAAFLRIRSSIVPELRWFLLGLPLFGVLSVPLSYYLLDVQGWALIPQFQPARATLFIVVMGIAGCGIAAARAAERGHFAEAWAWFAVPFVLPFDNEVLVVLLPDLRLLFFQKRFLVWAGLALLAAWAALATARRSPFAWLPWAAALALPFWLYPGYAKVARPGPVETPEMAELAAWANQSTDRDAVFLFPDAAKQLYPGVFRARALRAVYVDWKSGGQVNFWPRETAVAWHERWMATMEGPFDPARLDRYAGRGIHYLVVRSENRLPEATPAYQNARYAVYAAP